MKVPAHHQTVMVYLILNDPDGFISFTQNIFNAELTHRSTREDGTVMHAEVKIGENTIMFGKASDQWAEMTAGMFIYVDSADETYHHAIRLGSKSIQELNDQSYGRTCGILDPYGNTWWITSLVHSS